MRPWSLTSWQSFDCQQMPHYPNASLLNQMIQELSLLPPLVAPGEITHLKSAIAKAGKGEAFILQGGDCAEAFADCRPEIISNKLKILLQMSIVLFYRLECPIIRIGRIAGQYAKPRSSDFETIKGVTLPSYRGDLVNQQAFQRKARIPNPHLLKQGYLSAAMTLNYIRALLDGGMADFHHPESWDLEFVDLSPKASLYHQIVHNISQSLEKKQTNPVLDTSMSSQNEFYTSHEALHLHYEQALTRQFPSGQWMNLSTHLPWIGMRTAYEDSAHVEFLRGVENPIGIKIGPASSTQTLQKLLNLLNPEGEEGRIVLITRLGVENIETQLPKLIKATQDTKIPVTWMCDPMHGNTETTEKGYKTRHFDNILSELKQAVVIHHGHGSTLGGVHFELTGENVTECIGGARGLTPKDLEHAYLSLVDPRLNYEQSLEMALQLSQALHEQ